MNKDYRRRIDAVLAYIEANLASSISLAEVARVSCFSEFHFHRIFTGVVGEPVNSYIARRRLECAVNMLIFKPDLSVTDVALAAGYSSGANFAKVVKLHFGFSPSQIRNPDKAKDSKVGKIFSKYGKDFNPADLYPTRTNELVCESNLEGSGMKFEIRELNSLRVCKLSSDGGYTPEAIYSAWDKVIDWAQAQGIEAEQQQRFAFAFDNPVITPIEKCRYDASIVVGDDVQVNAPFSVAEIPQGKYAVVYYKGDPEQAIKAQLGIYSDWLPNSGFEPDDFPMLERYLNDVRVDGFIEMEIHVKLKPL